MRVRHPTTLFCLISLLTPRLAFSQAPAGTRRSQSTSADTYEDSAAGLRQQVTDALAAAKDHNRSKLDSLIKQMEIPEYEAWFTKSFGKEKGESWAGPYAQNLASNESDLASTLIEFASEPGELEIRKVNDAPRPGMEAALINAFQRSVDVYYAGWKKPPSSERFKYELIGYFVFLDGRYRWDSTIRPMKITIAGSAGDPPGASTPQAGAPSVAATENSVDALRPGKLGVGYPMCSYCPDPRYPQEGRDKHVEGTVVLQAIVTVEGTAADIKVVKSLTPDSDKAAVEAVERWRFKPALREGKEPVPVIVPIEIAFRLLK